MVFKLFSKFTFPITLQFQSSSPPKRSSLVAALYPTLSTNATSRGAATRHSVVSTSSSIEEDMNYWSSTPDESPIPTDIKEIIPLTTICPEQEINRATYKILQQCIDLLKSLPDDGAFIFESKFVPSSTIGKHVRHVCDHFRLLFNSRPVSTKRSLADEYFNDNDNDSFETLNESSDWSVDYDNRIRGGSIETSRITAIQQIERLQLAVLDYSTSISLNTPISIGTIVDEDPMHLQSTYGRELWFCCHHAIHHYALIRVICIELKIPYPEDFGIAPSTLLQEKSQLTI